MTFSATTTPTCLAELRDRKIAYRSLGQGIPIILCNRLPGILDNWDPRFIDLLAERFQVILFDPSGVGRSTGMHLCGIDHLVRDVIDLGRELGLYRFIVGGWSLGGIVAQSVAVRHPDMVSHLVLIGAPPPGRNRHRPESIFSAAAMQRPEDACDEVVLFFEPASKMSAMAARQSKARIAQRTVDRDIPASINIWPSLFELGREFAEDRFGAREKQTASGMPTLVVSGDHDLVFPVENWFELNRKHRSMQLLVFPQAGHAPHHQYPEATANAIHDFIHSHNNWSCRF